MLDVRLLEELCLNSSAPAEQLLYDGWHLRFARSDIKRARSITPSASSLPLEEKIARCEALYRKAGLPPLYRLSPVSQPPELDDALAALGYSRFETTSMQVAPLKAPFDLPSADLRFELMEDEPWVKLSARLHGYDAAREAAHQRRLDISVLPSWCLTAWHGDEPVASGRVTQDGPYASLHDIFTAETHRGQGIGTMLTSRLLDIAYEQGVRTAWLGVLADNAPATALYAKLGFEAVYEYWYRQATN